MMKNLKWSGLNLTGLACVALVNTGVAAVTVTDEMDELSGWSANPDWSTASGIAETSSASQLLTLSTGVPAPVNVGDFVTASIVQRVEAGATGLTLENQYATRLAIAGGDGSVAKAMWTRRQTSSGGAIWGAALSSPGTWKFGGWNSISEIGLATATSATSDWFTSELTITKAATGYDILYNVYDASNAVVWTDSSLGQDLSALSGQSTWYLNMGTEYQFTSAADLTKFEVDRAVLTSSIPEPSIALLGFFGLLGFARRRR
ncbi:hypothetical protein [Roseibacillus persicicus]|nr:hypothetical protein [Roseibacillus persicicus]